MATKAQIAAVLGEAGHVCVEEQHEHEAVAGLVQHWRCQVEWIAERLIEARAEIERLREDKARLDWLEGRCAWMKWSDMPFSPHFIPNGPKYVGVSSKTDEAMTVRDAIDMARMKKK